MPSPALTCRDDILLMFDELHDARQDILKECGALTPEQLADPVIPGTWPVLRNLQHLAFAEEFMLAWIKKRPEVLPKEEYPPDPPLELAAIKTALDEAHAAAIAFVKGHDESVLKEMARYGGDDPPVTVGGILFNIVRHEIAHRAFIRYKLRALRGE